ncbi:MAG: alpha/beta fold hydrolase [bacterium]
MPHIIVNDVELYYELHGKGNDHLVLNNGVMANTASWVYQVPVLKEHFRVLLYDMRGQGQSQKWREGDSEYTWDTHAADLAALLEALKINSANIGGISYGGELALYFALRYPDLCKRLIISNAVSHVEPQLRAIIESWILAAQTGDHELFYRSTWFWNFSEDFFADHFDLLMNRIEAAKALHLPSVIQLCRCFLKINITEHLQKIQQPVCVIVGEKDILKPVHYSATLARRIPNSELHILPAAGHASFWERPDEFNSILLGFLFKS